MSMSCFNVWFISHTKKLIKKWKCPSSNLDIWECFAHSLTLGITQAETSIKPSFRYKVVFQYLFLIFLCLLYKPHVNKKYINTFYKHLQKKVERHIKKKITNATFKRPRFWFSNKKVMHFDTIHIFNFNKNHLIKIWVYSNITNRNSAYNGLTVN